MALDTYFLSFEGGLWKLSSPGGKRAIRNFNTREEAMEYSTAYVRAHGGFLKIRTEDGKFQEKRTYPGSPRRAD
jgi:hypothetical protein